MARNKTWKHLEELNLSDNNRIGDEGAVEIGSNELWKNLKILSLETNQIGDVGGLKIAKNRAWNKLEELYIYNNKEFSEGCLSEFQADHWKQVKTLIYSIKNEWLKHFIKNDLEADDVAFDSEELDNYLRCNCSRKMQK